MSQETSLFCQVNRPKDMNAMTDLEKKHLPVISVPGAVKADQPFEVTVEVGKLLAHPNENGHFIEFIDLYAEDVFLARLDLTAVTTRPVLKIPVVLFHSGLKTRLRAFARCNLHGTWEGIEEIVIS